MLIVDHYKVGVTQNQRQLKTYAVFITRYAPQMLSVVALLRFLPMSRSAQRTVDHYKTEDSSVFARDSEGCTFEQVAHQNISDLTQPKVVLYMRNMQAKRSIADWFAINVLT